MSIDIYREAQITKVHILKVNEQPVVLVDTTNVGAAQSACRNRMLDDRCLHLGTRCVGAAHCPNRRSGYKPYPSSEEE